MRRTDRQLAREDGLAFLGRAHWGVLAAIDGDRPMCVPISYGVDGEGRLFFHGATAGRKAGVLKDGIRCSFAAVASAEPWLEQYKHLYESVIVEGTLRCLKGEEAVAALRTICAHYGDVPEGTDAMAAGALAGGAVQAWCLVPDSIEAKACRRP